MRISFILCLSLFIAFTGQAQLTSSQPYLTISSFNDSWGGGFTEIHDDKRSFGFQIDYQPKLFVNHPQIRLRYSSFTDRLAQDSSRLDELQLYLRIPVFRYKNHFQIDAVTGGYLIGNLGGEKMQNQIHSGFDVPTVSLPYSSDLEVKAILGANIHSEFDVWYIGDSTKVIFEPGVQYFLSPNYLQSFQVKVGFAATNPYADKIYLGAGFNNQDVFYDPTRQAVAQAENGFYINYGLRLGVATYSIYIFPQGNFSVGLMGITLLTGNNRKELKQVDLTAEFGSLTDDNGFYHRYLLNKLTENTPHFQIDMHYQFWTLTSGKLPEYPDRTGHYHQFSMGGNYSFVEPKNKFQILPYVSLRAGYKIESTYGGDVPGPYYNVWSFNGIGEGGLRIKLPAKILHNNCYYGLTANYQYVLTWYKSEDMQGVSDYPFAQNLGYFGIGGFVMIDL